MNENDLPGDVIGMGSSIAPEGVEMLFQQETLDITEFFRHTVTLRMDGHYGDYDKLTSGQSPDVNPPDSVIATFGDLSKTIQVTLWSLADGSGLGFWLDTDGIESWHVLRSKSRSGYVIDTKQLSLELGDQVTDDQINAAKVKVDVHLTGNSEPGAPFDIESGIILFTKVTLDGITARNSLLDVKTPPKTLDQTVNEILGSVIDESQDFIGDKFITAPAKDIQSSISQLPDKSRNSITGEYKDGYLSVAVFAGGTKLIGDDYESRVRNDHEELAGVLMQALMNQLRDAFKTQNLKPGDHLKVDISRLAQELDSNYSKSTLHRKKELHERGAKFIRSICDRHIKVSEHSKMHHGRKVIERDWQPLCAWHGMQSVEVDGIQYIRTVEIEPKNSVLKMATGGVQYYIPNGMEALKPIRGRGKAVGNWATNIALFLLETIRRHAAKSSNTKLVKVKRWDIITTYVVNPDPREMRTQKMSRTRIRKYYCDALRMLVSCGVLEPEGDAGSVNGLLNADRAYDEITGTKNKVDEWLNQIVTLSVHESLDPNDRLPEIGKNAARVKPARVNPKPRKRTP
jgi:hypothetical protein